MKHIFLNLKRFDIPRELGGVNAVAAPSEWAEYIVRSVDEALSVYGEKGEFVIFFPEAHILPAARAGMRHCVLGCQGVFREDVAKGGNFGAFTTGRTAKSMAALGCRYAIIGHCEERRDLTAVMTLGGGTSEGVHGILNREALRAEEAGLKVLFCVGENADETDRWEEVIRRQVQEGLANTDLRNVVVGYEPLWAIGPGRPVPAAEDIRGVARFIKSLVDCPVVYGGGLKEENAAMIAAIPEMDGGLIALTRFQGEIGFYPDEYLRIIRSYLE